MDCNNRKTAPLPIDLHLNNTMYIPFNEHFSLHNSTDGTNISFMAKDGKKKNIRISHWHLRPVFGLDTHKNSFDPTSRAIDILMQYFNCSEIQELKAATKAIQEISEARSQTNESAISELITRYGLALRGVMFRSHARLVIAPLLILANSNKKYEIINEPWPFPAPPANLYDLGNMGFCAKSKLGILAYPNPTSKDFWIVDQFDSNQSTPSESTDDFEHIEVIINKCLEAKMEPLRAEMHKVATYTDKIPPLINDYHDALNAPLVISAELMRKIHSILSPELERVWTAANTTSSYKAAADVLETQNIKMSTSTICRRVSKINKLFAANGIEKIKRTGPIQRARVSPSYQDENGNWGGGEVYMLNDDDAITPQDDDWAKDRIERDSIIATYLKLDAKEKLQFQDAYPGIDEQVDKYQKYKK